MPETARTAQTKPGIALHEIDRVRAAGICFGRVLADAGYGLSARFRQGLSARDLIWSLGVPRTQKVFTTGVGLLFPDAGRGKPRLHPVPSEKAQDSAEVLAACRWRRISWRRGSKGALAARFSALRVRVADGPRSPRHGHLPREEFWLVGERRSGGERKYYLSNLPPDTSLLRLAAAIKTRRVCEQAHQQLVRAAEAPAGDYEPTWR